MAACPVSSVPAVNFSRRRPLVLTPRRLAANRRNAARSTGPRTPVGKARVARNAIKHGFFTGQEKWTPQQHRDFEHTLEGFREDLKPQDAIEETCVTIIAQSYVRMAAMLRYENIAALKYHQRQDREWNERIAAADAPEAARLEAQRDEMRRAGLWRPTIPAPREAMAIIRYYGSLDRAISRATSELELLKRIRLGGASSNTKAQKQTHCSAPPNGVARVGEGPRAEYGECENKATVPIEILHEALRTTARTRLTVETNPLSSMFTGNRHQRRRAQALARGRRSSQT